MDLAIQYELELWSNFWCVSVVHAEFNSDTSTGEVITFKNAVDPIITFSDNGHVEISDLRKAFDLYEVAIHMEGLKQYIPDAKRLAEQLRTI